MSPLFQIPHQPIPWTLMHRQMYLIQLILWRLKQRHQGQIVKNRNGRLDDHDLLVGREKWRDLEADIDPGVERDQEADADLDQSAGQEAGADLDQDAGLEVYAGQEDLDPDQDIDREAGRTLEVDVDRGAGWGLEVIVDLNLGAVSVDLEVEVLTLVGADDQIAAIATLEPVVADLQVVLGLNVQILKDSQELSATVCLLVMAANQNSLSKRRKMRMTNQLETM